VLRRVFGPMRGRGSNRRLEKITLTRSVIIYTLHEVLLWCYGRNM